MSNIKQILRKTQILDIILEKASQDSRLEWLEETGKLVFPDTPARETSPVLLMESHT